MKDNNICYGVDGISRFDYFHLDSPLVHVLFTALQIDFLTADEPF